MRRVACTFCKKGVRKFFCKDCLAYFDSAQNVNVIRFIDGKAYLFTERENRTQLLLLTNISKRKQIVPSSLTKLEWEPESYKIIFDIDHRFATSLNDIEEVIKRMLSLEIYL